MDSYKDNEDLVSFIKNNFQDYNAKNLSTDAFTFADQTVLNLKQKIEKIGVPLKKWDVNINYGIKTGFNKAFIIDTETRDRILSNCKSKDERKRTEAIIKPILRGRDIGRYYYKWAGLWVIFIPWHFPLNYNKSIQGASEKAESEFKKQYPVVYEYLLQYKKQLSNRNKSETNIRYEWYALQRCAATYYPEFEKEKIVYGQFRRSSFAFDDKNMFLGSNEYMIVSDKVNLKFLLGVLNSKLSYYYQYFVSNNLSGNTAIIQKSAFVQLPIPKITSQNKEIASNLENLVNQILAITSKDSYDPKGDTEDNRQVKNLERQIDNLVYKLYNLTPDEIKIIEGSAR